jgi:hypothetical protein
MSQESQHSDIAGSYARRQQLFVRYFTAILIDLTVLNLFDEYWDNVVIGSFTISLLAALLLQVLLQITLKVEHLIAAFFKAKAGTAAKVMRVLSAWAVLFGSKFVILEAVNIAFGDQVLFKGPYHGIVAFIVVIVVMLAAEVSIVKFNKRLG